LKEHDFSCDLQVHPLGEKLKALDILKQMEENNLDLSVLLDFSWHNLVDLKRVMEVTDELKSFYNVNLVKENVYSFSNKKNGKKLFLILGSEVMPDDFSWHILSIGVTSIKDKKSTESIIEEIIKKGGLAIIDHPYVDTSPDHKFKDIGPEKEKKLRLICLRFLGRIALEWNGMCIPWIRRLIPGCTDYVNTKSGALSEVSSIPLIPTTDLHAWNKRLLKAIGTSRVEISSKDFKEDNVISSLKEVIFKKRYSSKREYVGFFHFLEAALPWLKGK
jgi:hypothetical protein